MSKSGASSANVKAEGLRVALGTNRSCLNETRNSFEVVMFS